MTGPDGYDAYREEREIAEARGEYEAARVVLAAGEANDELIARLGVLRQSVAPDLFAGGGPGPDDGPPVPLTPARVVLATEIDRALSSLRGEETTAELRYASARRRYDAAALHLTPSAELDRLDELAAEAMAVLPGRLDEAVDRLEAALNRRLARAGDSGTVLSLQSLTLAAMVARTGDADRAGRIIEEIESSRRAIYGADHPLTLVATARRILIALEPIEERPGVGFGTEDERASLALLLPAAKLLATTRTRILGEHATATIKAVGYVARIEFACARPAPAEEWARRAVTAAPEGLDRNDLALPIITVVLAQTLALSARPERAQRAHELAAQARGPLERSPAGQIWLARLAGIDELHAQAVARGRRRA
jgi:hypothetical protein